MTGDALTEARPLLPAWVALGPWLVGPAIGAVAAAGGLFLAWLGAPRETAAHWTEQARGVEPVRVGLVGTRLIAVVLALLALHATAGSWLGGPEPVRALVTLAAAWVPPTLVLFAFERRLRAAPPRQLLASQATMYLLVIPGAFCTTLAAALLPGLPPPWSWAVAALTLVIAVLGFRGSLVPVGAWLGLAHEPDERVRAAVARAAGLLGVPAPRVVELALRQANALALPLAGVVAVTKPLAALLDDHELEAIAAHEVGHLHEPTALKLQRPLVAMTALGTALMLSMGLVRTLPELLLALGCIAVLLVIARRTARRGETHADATAHRHAGHADDEAAYARALEKAYAFNLTPAVLRRAGPHGHLYDRLLAAGASPPYPRPAAPARSRLSGVVLLLLLGLVFAAAMARSGRAVDDDSALWHLALGDPTSAPLVALARGAVGAGDFAHAATWARAAVTLDPGDPDALGYQVMVAAVTGRCDEARASFRRLVESTPGQEGLHAQWRIYLGACPAP